MKSNNEGGDRPITLLNFYKAWIEDFGRLVAGGLRAESTLRKHSVIYKQISHFLREILNIADINLTDIKPSFIVDFHLYLKQTCHLAHNTIWNYLTPLQMLLHKAHQQGIIDSYPFADYHNRMEDTERCFLTQEELDRLAVFPFGNNHKRAFLRDLFVFCCYTGLAYIDLKQLQKDNIVCNPIDNQLWIHTHRRKTGTEINVKLLPVPLEILQRQATDANNKYVFEVPSLAACNKMLGTIAKKCNLKKHITWHVARHTMATVICLSNNVPIEVVGKLLGHKNIRSTQIYAKITKAKLCQEMDTLRERLAPQRQSPPLASAISPSFVSPLPSSVTATSVSSDSLGRMTRMTTERMASLLHAPLRSVEMAIMELTGNADATVRYALDTVLAVALVLNTPEAKAFITATMKNMRGE